MSETPVAAAPTVSKFQPTGLGLDIFNERYAAHKGETWHEACRRVARAIAAAEGPEGVQHWEDRFYDLLADGEFMPGGRIWFGAGQPVQQLLNCFVVPTNDSIEGWGDTIKEVLAISARGGGVGVNLSPVRGRGYKIGGMRGISTGAVSPMQMIDRCGDVLIGGGSRRMALMLCLDINHPDVLEFLDKKLDRKELNNANVSVVIPADMATSEFQRLVREDGEFPLMFNGVADRICATEVTCRGNVHDKYSVCRGDECEVCEGTLVSPCGLDRAQCECDEFTPRTIKAKWLWDRIVANAWNGGEPGVLNGDLANRMNNIWYHKPLISTNPCGEIWLEEYGCCCLGALVLPRFVKDGEFDFPAFDAAIRTSVRFLDNVLDVNDYPLPEIEKNCREVRRIGLGVMGLHTMLLKLGMKYNSEEAYDFVDELFSFKKNCEYDESATLAAVKGPFPAYDPRMLESGFMQTLKPGLRNKIAHHGTRNCAIATIAPTGTTAMVQSDAEGMTGGCEPDFAAAYYRRRIVGMDKNGEPIRTKTLVISANYLNHPDLAQGAYDITPADHIRMQVVVQKHIDNAVSKTINLPEDYPVEDLADIWLDNLDKVKGLTLYRQGSRGEEPMEFIAKEDIQSALDAALDSGMDVEYQLPEVNDCATGNCEVPFVAAADTSPVPA
jgi:ribonucleoside-diphosphate reductase alpha chain